MMRDSTSCLRQRGFKGTFCDMRIVFFALLFSALPAERIFADPPELLHWESPSQFFTAKPGDITARFTYKVVNVSGSEVVIDDVRPSCGCTTAELPGKPWRLAPHETNKMEVLVDLRGKEGKLFKTINVVSSNAPKQLTILLDIPPEAATSRMPADMANRLFGQQLGSLDHQAVFKKECVQCHLVPAFGKTGENLFHAACGICHEAKNRATMVPDLHALKTPIDDNYWENWVSHGKAGTLMPGFAAADGGPLNEAQVTSLVEYLTTTFPRPVQNMRPQPEDGD
jgi:cytochrome c553